MATTYLSRTPSSDGNQKTWTLSVWFKGGSLKEGMIFTYSGTSSARSEISLGNNQELYVAWNPTGSSWYYSNSSPTRRLRDPNAWYHLVVGVDTTQATASNRVKIYLNGEQVGSELIDTYPTQNQDTGYNKSGYSHEIGRYAHSGGNYFDGQMAHMHWIDGTQYAASDFGETDSTTGIWIPKTAPSVNYGTNGFFLKFENSGAMGTDSSGQGNNYAVSAGTMTQLIDTPDNVFATWNPLHHSTQSFSNVTLKNGNTTFDNNETGSGVYPQGYSTLAASSGKYYFESKVIASSTDASMIGISGAVTTEGYVGSDAYTYVFRTNGDIRNNNNTTSSWGNGWGVGDIVQIAVDLDNNKIYFGINGTWQNSGDPTSGSTGTGAAFTITAPSSTPHGFYHFTLGDTSSTGSFEHATNFGNGYFGTTAVSSAQNPDDGIGIFEYDVPAGYRALCTKSINAEEYS